MIVSFLSYLFRKSLFIFFVCAGISLVSAKHTHAQSLKLQLANPTQQIGVGDTFDVNVMINTGGVEAINGDALIQFDPAYVSVQSAKTGNFFTYFSSSPLSGNPNQYLASSWEESVVHAKSSTSDTLFAVLNMKAVSAGTSSVSFICTPGSEADSNINRSSDSNDILTNCSALTPLTLTIGGSSSGNPTSTQSPGQPSSTPAATSTPLPTVILSPSATPTITFTPTPSLTRTPTMTKAPIPTVSTLPRAGVVETTLMMGGAAAVLLTIGGLLFIL